VCPKPGNTNKNEPKSQNIGQKQTTFAELTQKFADLRNWRKIRLIVQRSQKGIFTVNKFDYNEPLTC